MADPFRIAVWGDPADRDLFINGEVRGTMFGSSDNTVETARHASDRKNYQEVGLAAVFMS